MSGRAGASLLPSPLRTERARFPSTRLLANHRVNRNEFVGDREDVRVVGFYMYLSPLEIWG